MGIPADGNAYICRSEAKSVPSLLVAPPSSAVQTQDEDLYADYGQGHYADGAFTATALPSIHTPYARPGQQEEEDIDPLEAYYISLCARFSKISQILQNPLTPTGTDSTKPPIDYWHTRKWRNKLLNTTPTMALLGQLPQEMVIHGLTNLESTLTSNNVRTGKGKNIGAWAWGMLARCRDVGQMGSEEVGVLRDLGKRAVWLLRRIAAGEVVDAGPEEVEIGDEEEVDEDEETYRRDEEDDFCGGGDTNGSEGLAEQIGDEEKSLAEARARILSSLPQSSQAQGDLGDSSPSKNDEPAIREEHVSDEQPEVEISADMKITPVGSEFDKLAMHAMLDMLVTIIGECYGQRDLLDGRLLWDEIDGFQ